MANGKGRNGPRTPTTKVVVVEAPPKGRGRWGGPASRNRARSGNTGKGRGNQAYVVAVSPPVPRGGLQTGKGKGRGGPRRTNNGAMGQGRGAHSTRTLRAAFNAFSKSQLGLPRAVGDYCYITTIDNTTVKGSGADQLWCFCPWQYQYGDPTQGGNLGSQGLNMNNYFGWNSNNGGIGGIPVNGIQLLSSKAIGDAFQSGCEAVPASMSIRITCPTPLQTAKGQFFLGKWNIACDPREYGTYQDIRDGFMSYGQPRPLTAAKLAMAGVQVNAMPRNMGECSDFLHCAANSGPAIADITPYNFANLSSPWTGLSPIFLVLESSVPADTALNVQIAIKWRFRFPINNPAVKTHSYQNISADTTWNTAMKIASDMAHGVEAITSEEVFIGAMGLL